MISDRCFPGTQRGYRDCFHRRQPLHTRENDTGSFYAHDYIEGWEMCLNDLYWDAVRENQAHDARIAAKGKSYDHFLFELEVAKARNTPADQRTNWQQMIINVDAGA